MRILVVGAGSIGRRHIGNLNSLGYKNIDIVDPNEEALTYMRRNFQIEQVHRNLEEVLDNWYDLAFVLTPPSLHIPVALKLAGKGIHLFIEKPLSSSMEGIGKLDNVVKKNGLVVMVGYNQRFDIGISELKSELPKIGKIYYVRAEFGQYLPDWRPWQDYRKSYTAKKELGGGILLDASHEIDYVLWLIDRRIEKVSGYYKKVSTLEIETEDLAEVFIEFEDDITASIHMNMIERGYNRYVKIIGEKGNLKYRFKTKNLTRYDGEKRLIYQKTFEDFEINQTYLDEMKHFLECVELREKPLITLEDGKRVLDVVLAVKQG